MATETGATHVAQKLDSCGNKRKLKMVQHPPFQYLPQNAKKYATKEKKQRKGQKQEIM